MAIDEIVTDTRLVSALHASRDARLQALNLINHISTADISAETQIETSKQQKLLVTNLAQLRGLHRAAFFDARNTKHETAEARQEVDRLHLQLQNLYYEQRHLQGEIAACESYESVLSVTSKPSYALCDICLPGNFEYSFESSQVASELIQFQRSHTYQQLPLIPVEQFLALKPEHANDDENALMIARIEHERSERESLEQKRMEVVRDDGSGCLLTYSGCETNPEALQLMPISVVRTPESINDCTRKGSGEDSRSAGKRHINSTGPNLRV